MRKSNPLDALISPTTQQILAAILVERLEPWYLSDLAKRLGRTPSTLQRPLDALVRAGILKRRSEGNRVYFVRDTDCPYLSELQGILVKSVALVDILRRELRAITNKIQVAFVHGSIVTGQERPQSDVDLLVIGSATLADLSTALETAEKHLGRPVNPTIYPYAEFADKIERKNHFLRSVLAGQKIFVVGTEHDLERLARPRKSRTARHKQGGAR